MSNFSFVQNSLKGGGSQFLKCMFRHNLLTDLPILTTILIQNRMLHLVLKKSQWWNCYVELKIYI